MKKTINKKSVALLISYITIIVNIGLSIWHTPILLKYLGDTNNGIRNFALTIANYLSLFSFGMGGAYLRFLSIQKKTGDEEKVKKTNAIFLLLLLVSGFLVFIFGITLAILVNHSIVPVNIEYGGQEKLISTILLICTISTSISIPSAIFPLIIDSKEKFVWKNTITLIGAIVSPVVSVIVLLLFSKAGMASDGLTIAISISALCVDFLLIVGQALYCFLGLKARFSFKFKKDDFKQALLIIKFSFFVFLVTTIISINNSTDKIILGSLVSYAAVTYYTLSVLFDSYLKMAQNAMSSICAPLYSRLAVDENINEISRISNFCSEGMLLFCSLIIGGYAACGENFIMSWLGQSYANVFYFSLPLLMSNMVLIGATLSHPIHRALGKVKIPALIYTLTFIINLIISLILVNYIEIWGCIIGTIFSYVCESVAISIYNSKYLNIPQKQYWINLIKYVLMAGIPAFLIHILFFFVNIDMSSWLLFVIKGLLFLIIFVPTVLVTKRSFIKELKNFLVRKSI